MSKKQALIFGVTGQDGSYLSELLLTKGYAVCGVKRRSSTPNTSRLATVLPSQNFRLVEGDVTDPSFVNSIIREGFSEVYNLAAQSHVGVSFQQPHYTSNVAYNGVLNILEAIKTESPTSRMYQASTSEMWGMSRDTDGFQRESTPYLPCSPYGVAKLAAHHLCNVYRQSYNLFVSCGTLGNHESPRRGEEFVTRKITRYLGKFSNGEWNGKLQLGNLSACRDWGYAGDYVEAMWLMLQQERPDDFVVATGETHSVYEFLVAAFEAAGLDKKEIQELVEVCDSLKRPFEVPILKGDASKAKELLGWVPKTSFIELVEKMVGFDIGLETGE